MGAYAASGSKEDKAELEAAPVSCQVRGAMPRIAELAEASGLAISRRDQHVMWTHNDSGDPAIYAVGLDGKVRGRMRLAGASVADWEAVTSAPCGNESCLYVGDIGDNDVSRSNITIYRIPEPSLADSTTAPVAVFEGVYPDGPQDAEAMFVADGSLYIVSKGEKSAIRVYRFPALEQGSPLKLQLVSTLTDHGARKTDRITDAALSPDRTWVALRTNDRLLFYKTAALTSGSPGMPLAFDLTVLKEPQGEGVAWGNDNNIYLAGESEGGGTFAHVSCELPAA